MADDEQDTHAPEVRPVSSPTSGGEPFQITHVQVERRHLGPLPPPEQLRAYDEIIPGAAREIWDDYRARVRHREELERRDQQMEQQALTANITVTRRAQLFAFAGAILFGMMAFVLVLTGHDAAGSVVFGTTIASLIGAFIAGRVRSDRNRDAHDTESEKG
jgi:uncharacterized membrane protein